MLDPVLGCHRNGAQQPHATHESQRDEWNELDRREQDCQALLNVSAQRSRFGTLVVLDEGRDVIEGKRDVDACTDDLELQSPFLLGDYCLVRYVLHVGLLSFVGQKSDNIIANFNVFVNICE